MCRYSVHYIIYINVDYVCTTIHMIHIVINENNINLLSILVNGLRVETFFKNENAEVFYGKLLWLISYGKRSDGK